MVKRYCGELQCCLTATVTHMTLNPTQDYIITLFNPLNAKLNPICHLLALLGAHPIFHVSRIRVKPSKKAAVEIPTAA